MPLGTIQTPLIPCRLSFHYAAYIGTKGWVWPGRVGMAHKVIKSLSKQIPMRITRGNTICSQCPGLTSYAILVVLCMQCVKTKTVPWSFRFRDRLDLGNEMWSRHLHDFLPDRRFQNICEGNRPAFVPGFPYRYLALSGRLLSCYQQS